MFDLYQWASSKVTPRGNTYYRYPKDEDEFKRKVAESGGMVVEVYQNGELIHSHETRSKGEKWKSPVFFYLKTMSINSKKFDYFFSNCEFCAVPKSLVSILSEK